MSNEDRTKVQATIPGKREQIATRVAFFIGGFASAVWAPLIPFAKQRLHLDDGGLGLLILCFGLGSLSTMALAGWAAGRFGCRRVIRLGTLLACLALPFLATLSSTIPFVVALLLFGSAIGAIDVTVNVQAVIVEKAGGRPLMSGFHAGWSIGGFAGAILLTGLFSLGLQPWMAVLVPIIAILALHFLFASGLLPYANESSEKQKFAFPHGIILAIGALCFISFLAEGAILDWGGVFLTSNKNVAIAYAGLGYAGFSLTMLICRLTGDRIVHRIGGFRVLLFGGLIGAAGFAAGDSRTEPVDDGRRIRPDRDRNVEHRARPLFPHRKAEPHACASGGLGCRNDRVYRHPARTGDHSAESQKYPASASGSPLSPRWCS